MLTKIPVLLIATVLAVGRASYASGPLPMWESKWSAHVWNNYCALNLEYSIPNRRDRDRRGLLAGRSLDRLFIRFSASTRSDGLIPVESLGKIRFELFFYGEDGHVPAVNDHVVLAKFDEFKMVKKESRNDWIESFWLSERDSLSMLEKLSDHEAVELIFQFADGETRKSKIYPSGDRDFHVWTEMFKTCIRESIN